MRSSGRKSADSRSSSSAEPKCMNRPPLQVPRAVRVGPMTVPRVRSQSAGVVTCLVVGRVERVRFGAPIVLVALVTLFFIADIGVVKATDAPRPGQTKVTIDVVGHQWFWEVRYPGTPAVTANEIHIPVGTPVKVVVTTADVIHSFWVPELNKKGDTIPG